MSKQGTEEIPKSNLSHQPDHLSTFADHLSSRREQILAAWSAAARRDPGLTTAATLSRSEFFDHIPSMLDALERKLRAASIHESLSAHQDEVVDAEQHGLQRWQQGYDEGEVMREWVSLNGCLAAELDIYAAGPPERDPHVISMASGMVSEFTITGMSESVAQYSRLLRTEAAGRVHALEEALQQLNEVELQRAVLWREATHDLRGNVGVVRNVTQVLRMTGLSDAVAAGAVAMLDRSVAALHALLDDLTVQARLDAGQEKREARPVDAAAVLKEICANSQLMADSRGFFLRVEGPEHLLVEGDEVKIRRIAQNLLQNALMYTKEGGIVVSWELLEQAPRRWVMCIQDTGPGLGTTASAPLAVALEAATRAHLNVEADAGVNGEPSSMTGPAPTLASRSNNPRPHGEGVGLSIVKRLCELLDANLELQTEAGKGTTFRVTFPSVYPKG